jgi:hypothetical protein
LPVGRCSRREAARRCFGLPPTLAYNH